jgi:hypothetical protein
MTEDQAEPRLLGTHGARGAAPQALAGRAFL